MLMGMNTETPPLMEYLEKKGVTLKDLISTALELFVRIPAWKQKRKPRSCSEKNS
jgi:hypothetical protein